MIESKARFEVDGFRQYQIFRSKIGVLPPMRFAGPRCRHRRHGQANGNQPLRRDGRRFSSNTT